MDRGRSTVSWVSRGARRVDRELWSRIARRRVLVEARTPMNLAVLRPVLEPLLKDPRLRVHVTGVGRPDLEDAFEELHVRDQFISREKARWARWDLYMNADPWEAVRLRRAWRQVNFSHGVAGKYDLDCPAGLPLNFARYSRVAFPNESRLQQYVRAGVVSRDQAALVGFPKVDALLEGAVPPRELAATFGLDPSRPTAIYAPTFSPASSLHDAGERIIETLLACGWNTIAKLHDRSLDPDPRYNGGIDWRKRFSRFASHSGFVLAQGGDSTPFVRASDIMITDHSSIGFEFCTLDRPLIVYDAPRPASAARINPGKIDLLRSAASVVTNETELAGALRMARANPSFRSAERRRVANEVFYRPGTATARALGLVYELLDLAPRLEHLSRPARAWSAVE